MDKKLIRTTMIISIILLLGVLATPSFAIELPWEKEKKEETRKELTPPQKIPDATPQPPSLEDAKKYFDEGVAYQKDKKYNEAISSYTRVIELKRNYADAYYNRGFSKSMIGDYEGALDDYNKAIEINPKFYQAYSRRGYLKQVNLKDFQGAIRDYDMSIEINPKDFIIYLNRGAIKYGYGVYEGAVRDYEKSLEINPNSDNAKKGLEMAKEKLKGTDRVNVLGLVLAGDWVCNGRPVRIMQFGDSLNFINEYGQRSNGHFVKRQVVVAVDWEGGLQGHVGANINGAFFGPTEARDRFGAGVNEIRWANGTIWKLVK